MIHKGKDFSLGNVSENFHDIWIGSSHKHERSYY